MQTVLLHDATKNYTADHNTMREAQLHDDRKSYRSEPEAIFPFSGEAAGHKMVVCCTENLCGRATRTLMVLTH